MDSIIQGHWAHLWSTDRAAQNQSFFALLEATNQPVDWAYEVWDELVGQFTHADNHNRAIAAQLLCSLAKSDPEIRMLSELPALLALTKDARFVTARHCMQSLWKIGVAGKRQQQQLVRGLEIRFRECITEKNGTLIRSDILQSLRNVYDVVHDEEIRLVAQSLIDLETDAKYRKKYAQIWIVR